MMNKKNLPHFITVVSFVVYIILGLACATMEHGQSGTQPRLSNANAYWARARTHYQNQNWELAVEDYTQVIRLAPDYAPAYNSRAWTYAYHLKTNYFGAIADANQALKLDPNNANYLDTRGWAYLGNGEYDKAIADFQTALQINPVLQSSMDGLAAVRQAQPGGSAPVLAQQQPAQVLAQATPNEPKNVETDFEVRQNPDNTLTITGYIGSAKNVVIPDTLYGLKVTTIAGAAFRNKGITSVVIPNTVVTIENGDYSIWRNSSYYGAFSSNEQLTRVTLGDGLQTIGMYAFLWTGITEIVIPNSVTYIGERAFSQSKLSTVTFGSGLQAIGEIAFAYNEIVELTLPSSLRTIGVSAFKDNKIQRVTFGTGLQTIEAEAFRDNQITELNLPSSLKTINGAAFAGNQIQTITIPNGVTRIENYLLNGSHVGAFANNPLTTVVIPASLANGYIAGQYPFGTSPNSPAFGNRTENSITRIIIPAKMDGATLSGIFEDSFVNFWINQNKAGGTYIKRGPIWTKE